MSQSFSRRLTRRSLIGAAGATFAAAMIPRWASAAGMRDPRLVVVVLRGALDGLSAVAPIGDPDYADLHGALALRWDGAHPALRLDSFFGLNPSMTNLYQSREKSGGAPDPGLVTENARAGRRRSGGGRKPSAGPRQPRCDWCACKRLFVYPHHWLLLVTFCLPGGRRSLCLKQ